MHRGGCLWRIVNIVVQTISDLVRVRISAFVRDPLTPCEPDTRIAAIARLPPSPRWRMRYLRKRRIAWKNYVAGICSVSTIGA